MSECVCVRERKLLFAIYTYVICIYTFVHIHSFFTTSLLTLLVHSSLLWADAVGQPDNYLLYYCKSTNTDSSVPLGQMLSDILRTYTQLLHDFITDFTICIPDLTALGQMLSDILTITCFTSTQVRILTAVCLWGRCCRTS